MSWALQMVPTICAQESGLAQPGDLSQPNSSLPASGHQSAQRAPQWKAKKIGRPVRLSAVPKASVSGCWLPGEPLNLHQSSLTACPHEYF